jgi:alpha-maltose-1-phosphate synthase
MLGLSRVARNRSWQHWADEKYVEALDRTAARSIEPCDVFIGMSGMCNKTAATVKRRFGAQVWIERASRHILSQKAILEAIPGAEKVPEYAVKRELRDYDLADVVNVPSRQCETSFHEYGFDRTRLHRNPFGVALETFSPTVAPPANPPTIIMAGTWCLRKGCDVLTQAWRTLTSVRLVHVGPVSDCPVPTDPLFAHHDKVDQTELRQIYSTAHVFALASREEGLAFVQAQALACGLRLVCTDRTGGEDLGAMLDDPSGVRVVPAESVDEFAAALRLSLADSKNDHGFRDRLGVKGRFALSWRAYAQRYEAVLHERLGIG